jgi:carboxylate-amine ligase
MIVDPSSMELVSAVEEMILSVPSETEGQVKPELLQSVLEISTDVCRNAGEAAGQLEELRRRVRETAERRADDQLRRHPSVRRWETSGSSSARYHESSTRSAVARQELLFGCTSVGIDAGQAIPGREARYLCPARALTRSVLARSATN